MLYQQFRKSFKEIAIYTGIEKHHWFSMLRMYAENLHPKTIRASHVLKYKSFFPIWEHCEIETYSYCNRDCSFCPRYNDRSGIRKDKNGRRIKVFMPEDKVYDLIDQVDRLGFKGSFRFGRLSEAICDPRYIKFAGYVKSKGIKLNEVSNGDKIRNNDELVQELDGLVDRIVIGLYDYTNETLKREQMKFWKDRFKKTEVGFSLPLEKCVVRQGTNYHEQHNNKPLSLDLPCFATRKLLIRYDGNVSLCCEDDQCTFDLGNVFDKNIEEIWWSKKHINVVNSLRKFGSRMQYDLCRICYATDDSFSITSGENADI